jgi:hypothetical protein
MKKGENRKQEKAIKRRAQSKLARKESAQAKAASAVRYIHQARGYPLEGCWVQSGWTETGLAVVTVARQQPNGNIVFGNYLVDHFCLGLKDTYCRVEVPPEAFHQDYLPRAYSEYQAVSISPALAHEIIYGGIEYAARFGFSPHHDFALSQDILDPPDAHPQSGKVTFGYKEGKPLYVSGPRDDVQAIMDQLMRTAGPGNFDYLVAWQAADDLLDSDGS